MAVAQQPLMFRNKLINGAMNIWQRGNNTTGSGFFADRWFVSSGVTSAVENAGGSPTGFRRNAYIRRSVSGNAVVAQRIESMNCIDLVGKQATLQFHHTTASGTCSNIAVSLYYANTEDTFSSSTLIQTINITDTSTGTKIATFNALPSNAANGLELRIDYTVSGDTYVRLTAAQLEVGGQATAFEQRPIGTELVLCQRYYEKSYPMNTVPGTVTGVGSIPVSAVSTSELSMGCFKFAVEKRTNPTVRIYNNNNGNNDQVSEYTLSPLTFVTNRAVSLLTPNGTTSFKINGSSNLAAGRYYDFHWSADAEL
jgi:hypothetical protein